MCLKVLQVYLRCYCRLRMVSPVHHAGKRQGHSYSNQNGSWLLNNLFKHYAGTHYRYDERGNQWHHGMRMHIGVDAESGLVHNRSQRQ